MAKIEVNLKESAVNPMASTFDKLLLSSLMADALHLETGVQSLIASDSEEPPSSGLVKRELYMKVDVQSYMESKVEQLPSSGLAYEGFLDQGKKLSVDAEEFVPGGSAAVPFFPSLGCQLDSFLQDILAQVAFLEKMNEELVGRVSALEDSIQRHSALQSDTVSSIVSKVVAQLPAFVGSAIGTEIVKAVGPAVVDSLEQFKACQLRDDQPLLGSSSSDSRPARLCPRWMLTCIFRRVLGTWCSLG